MLKTVLAFIFTCVVSVCVYAHHTPGEKWDHLINHSHPNRHCYGKRWDDKFQNGYIHKDHADHVYPDPAPEGVTRPDPNTQFVFHIHRNARKITGLGVVALSEGYYNAHRQFYCNDYKCGGVKPAQRVYTYPNPVDDPAAIECVEEAAADAPKLPVVSPMKKLAVMWASLKQSRI